MDLSFARTVSRLLRNARPFAGCVVALLLAMSATPVMGQYTAITGTGIPNLWESASAWADYNKDGYIDLAISGTTDTLGGDFAYTKAVTRIYRNNGNGTWTLVNSLEGTLSGTLAWGDYDNDGYPDIIIGGVNQSNQQITKLYHNDNGTGVFTENTLTAFHSSSYGSLSWGDYNNDGWVDLLLTAFDNAGPVTKLYRNNHDGTFPEVATANIMGLNGHSRSAWGDFDNDGFQDILVCGRSTTNPRDPKPMTKLYHNNAGNGTFTEVTAAALVGVWSGAVAFIDYDKDGYLDVFVTGQTTSIDTAGFTARDTTVLYRNVNGTGTFTNTGRPFNGTRASTVAIGDFNSDGWPDIFFSGYNGADLAQNGTDGSWADIAITRVSQGTISIADVNNDGYFDMLESGIESVVTNRDTTMLLRYSGGGSSASYTANTKPTPPASLNETVVGTTATLTWGAGSDATTSDLTYNLRIGSTAGGIQRLSPLADTTAGASNGFRRVPRLGAMQHAQSWKLNNMTGGRYFWAVQAVDNAFAGSAFSSERSFTVPFTITASAGTGGTITPSGAVSVAPDANQTFTIAANAFYRIDSVIVDGLNQGSLTTYTFNTVTANHTIRVVFAANRVTKTVKFFLEGPYSSAGLMSTGLKNSGILGVHFATPIPGTAVDSVNIEIRDSLTVAKSTKRKFAAAWLLANGTIRNFTDTTKSYVEYDSLAPGRFYIVVHHRNHLAIMSATSDSLWATVTPVVYDFSTAQGQAYGTTPMKAVSGGLFAMKGGDGNDDGGVDALDRNNVWRPSNGLAGYRPGDFNLDGGVDALDRNLIWRTNNGSATQVP